MLEQTCPGSDAVSTDMKATIREAVREVVAEEMKQARPAKGKGRSRGSGEKTEFDYTRQQNPDTRDPRYKWPCQGRAATPPSEPIRLLDGVRPSQRSTWGERPDQPSPECGGGSRRMAGWEAETLAAKDVKEKRLKKATAEAKTASSW